MAIILLAGGFMLWTWRNGEDLTPSESVESTRTSSDAIPMLSVSSERVVAPTHSIDIESVFSETLRELRYAPPFKADIQLSVRLFEEWFPLAGQYFQAGEGTPKARLDLFQADDPASLLLTQSFDGRFYYHVQYASEDRRFEYVDLYQIAQLETPTVACVAGVKGWFGTGGIIPMLEQLAASFDFVEKSKSDSFAFPIQQACSITVQGTWKRETLHQLLRDQIDSQWLEPQIQWRRLPGQLPQMVEITFATDGSGPLYPTHIQFFVQDKESSEPNMMVATMALETRKLTSAPDLTDDWFRISPEGFDPVDDTNDYLARIKMFLFQPVK
ncbi:MAG: hypothetical protein R3C03_06620 [Pirellulaceae bacterium]